MASSGLTYRHQMFVCEYLLDLDARHAAIRAGYSAKTAQAQASRLLHRPDIAEAIQQAMNERAARLGITPERVIEEYARLAFADMRLLVDWSDEGVRIKDPSALDDQAASAIASIANLPPLTGRRRKQGDRTRVTLFEKKRALDSLALILGLDLPDAKWRPAETVT